LIESTSSDDDDLFDSIKTKPTSTYHFESLIKNEDQVISLGIVQLENEV